MTSQLSLDVNKRKYVRAQVTRYHSNIEDYSDMSESDRRLLVKTLVDIKAELLVLDGRIQLSKTQSRINEEDMMEEIERADTYLGKLRELFHILVPDPIEIPTLPPDTPQSSNRFSCPPVNSRSMLKSPTAPLPVFRSEPGESLETFLRNFEETLSKFDYTEYDLLLLLKQQVEGKGAFLLESLEPNNQTYAAAKTLLNSAFASTDIQRFNIIKQLSEIKLHYDGEPFKYISEMRKIQQAVESLGIDVDDVMRYFFLNGLNESFKAQLVQITNSVRPTLAEIFDKFFDANERYLASQSKFRDRRKNVSNDHSFNPKSRSATTMALSAEINSNKSNPFINCSLCPENSGTRHGINKCPRYVSAQEKIKRLKQINACVKCGFLEHHAASCSFRFKNPCRSCSEWHFTFLCTAPKEVNPHRNLSHRSVTNSVAIVSSVLCGYSSTNSVLSTFSCGLDGKLLRGLRDSGSQSNLITERALLGHNFEILDDRVSLTINGINYDKTYLSKHVLLKLKIGDEIKTIDALTLPSISLTMNLPGLSKVIDSFVSKGYKLADEFLRSGCDCVSDIDLILGANYAYCFFDDTVRFGVNNSLFLSTQLGVMMLGNLANMISDMDYLPVNSVNGSGATRVARSEVCLLGTTHKTSTVNVAGVSDLDEFLVNDNFNSQLLDRAPVDILEQQCDNYLSKSNDVVDDENSDQDKEIIEYLLANTKRKDDGRLIVPLLWNDQSHHLLANNYQLAKNVLLSNKKKLKDNFDHLKLIDSSIVELVSMGAIEKIHNLDTFVKEFPNCSFLAHMPIIKMGRESTKCRIVYLSNMCDKREINAVSHNQAMLSGPCLNQKLSVALIHLRFGYHILCFDLRKAFLQLELSNLDQSKLLFLWFRDPVNGDFAIEAYKNIRLSFGLRCSPTILMLALYKILVVDTENDSNKLKDLKRLIYSLIYMDNGAITYDNEEDLVWAYNQLNGIFNPYKFELQQFCTNSKTLNDVLPDSDKNTSAETELFGLIWNRETDSLSSKPKKLNIHANTKRLILKSIAENFDPYNFDGPIMNRSRLFLHDLQLRKDLKWDTTLPTADIQIWTNIVKQVNSSKPLTVPRFVGERNGSYDLIAFCDSSKMLYGTVIYIQNCLTKQVNFILAKNRMVSKQLEDKSIPSLELASAVLAAECLTDLHHELSGPLCLHPIDISNMYVYSDSLVALSWINSFFLKFNKMNKQTVFVMNKLKSIQKFTDIHPITFSFVDGFDNPSDFITRPISYKILSRTNYLTGPAFLVDKNLEMSRSDILTFTVPPNDKVITATAGVVVSEVDVTQPIVDCSRFSKLTRFIGAYSKVLMFIAKLKSKVSTSFSFTEYELERRAFHLILRDEQNLYYSEVFSYFSSQRKVNNCEIPNIITQMNLFIDGEGLIRVGSKLSKGKKFQSGSHCPILLPKSGYVTNLIVEHAHSKLNHSGIYSVLSDLRKKFWIPQYFSCIKKTLKNCMQCKRFKQRNIKLNQSPYRDFRLNPTNIAFSDVFIDHIGPFFTKDNNGDKTKSYLLIITCLWTRAVNLVVSTDLTTVEFLRAFQIHNFSFGMPQRVYSDLGSQIVAGSNIISDFLNDHKTFKFFSENNMKTPSFQAYFKGHSELGSLVESLVKQTKLLIYGAIKNYVLSFRDFEFIVAQTVSLINKRIVAFKECLRGNIGETLPQAITPELLIYGRNMPSVNTIPYLQSEPVDPDWKPTDEPIDVMRATFSKLRSVRTSLVEKYNEEFQAKLIYQAVNERDRYAPVTHKALKIGDIVLLKEQHAKPAQYPMAVVKQIVVNDLEETTGAVLLKGNSRELVKRHASCIVPLLRPEEENEAKIPKPEKQAVSIPRTQKRGTNKRKAFLNSKAKTKKLLSNL